MKKTLHEDAILNELKGASSFFRKEEHTDKRDPESVVREDRIGQRSPRQIEPRPKEAIRPKKVGQPVMNETNNETVIPRHQDTIIPRYPDEFIESIRKAVKQLGKEAATYRFTSEEKKALADIVYTYKNDGIRTSENEITRTAINFIVEDYRRHGLTSILAIVLERLNS